MTDSAAAVLHSANSIWLDSSERQVNQHGSKIGRSPLIRALRHARRRLVLREGPLQLPVPPRFSGVGIQRVIDFVSGAQYGLQAGDPCQAMTGFVQRQLALQSAALKDRQI